MPTAFFVSLKKIEDQLKICRINANARKTSARRARFAGALTPVAIKRGMSGDFPLTGNNYF